MKLIKKLITLLVSVLAVFFIIGFFLPDRTHVERAVLIKAPATNIFPLINDFKHFNRWSPWYEKDPNVEQSYSEQTAGVGASLTWNSTNTDVGAGSQKIIESVDQKMVRTSLDFGARGTAFSSITIKPAGNYQLLSWDFDSEFGYDLIGRYLGLMMDKWIGADYEKGLAKLKAVAEAPTAKQLATDKAVENTGQ